MTTSIGTDLETLRARVQGELATRLPEHIGRLEWDESQLLSHQRRRLRALLARAIERSSFHARRLDGFDVDRVGLCDLAGLPVMTKADMMESFDDVVTDRRLDRRIVEDHLAASTREPSLLLGEYVCLASGGSSGRRGVFVQTVGEYVDFVASLMRRPMARLMAAGGPPPGGLIIGLVAAASPVHSTGFGAAATSGGPVRLVAVPATLPLSEIVDRLNTMQPPVLMGYSTKLAQLAGEQRAGRLRLQPRSVTATSELLTGEDRATITGAFGVPVVDQFASTEGLVGHSEPGGSVLTFASDMCIVEPVDADNRLVGHDTLAAKVLVTNLHNLTQPLIRYELTDRFVCHPTAELGHLRATVEGRADDVFQYDTVALHPLVVRTVMVNTPAVTEYQVCQTERGLHVDAVVGDDLDDAALAASLENSLRGAGLQDPQVTVRKVDRIERHPETGKARRFIPLDGLLGAPRPD
jgi:phenylacetate-coenzyme A ligase PaaK-like adenylate-forming protein